MTGGHMPGTLGALVYQRDDWETPAELYAAENRKHAFNLDACANAFNAKVAWHYDREGDALTRRWTDGQGGVARVWLHPPHSECDRWARKAVIESRRGALVVGLFPARTGEGWWHEYVIPYAVSVRFLRGTPAFRLRGAPLLPLMNKEAPRQTPAGGFAIITWMPLEKQERAAVVRNAEAHD